MTKSIAATNVIHLQPDPFGMITSGRNWETGSGYRYGFNGKDGDREVYGDDNAVDFGARVYNARLGKWFSVDPYSNLYPSISPYTYCFNSPLKFVDVNGEKVYFIGALNELQGFDENEEPIYKQTKVIIDISNAEQVNDYLNNSFALDKDMLIAYSESKKIASTTDILKYFEQSTTEDIYIFKSTISLTSSANTKAVGNTYAQVKDVDNDGKFNPSKDINFSGIPLYLQYAAVDIAVAVEGLEIPIPTNGTLNFIQLDPELFSSNLQFHGYLIEDENFAIKTQVTATLHEIVDHVEASRNGIPVEQQHEVAFGTDTDLPQLAKDDSPFGKRENEINNIYDEDK